MSFKNINNWVFNHALILLLVLVVAIIPLYAINLSSFLIDRNEKIMTLIVNLIVSVAAVVSIYYLYLTFQQARIANELKVSEPSFDELHQQIAEKEKLAWLSVFSNEEEKVIYETLGIKKFIGDSVYYSYFIDDMSMALNLLSTKTKYSDYLKLLNNNYHTEISLDYFDLENVTKTATVLKILYTGLDKVVTYYLDNFIIYESIHKSSLQDSQKVWLLTKLNKILDDDFQILLKSVFSEPTKEKGYYQNSYNRCNEIRNIIFFEYHAPNYLLRLASVFVNIRPEYDYRKIKEYYKFS